MEIPLIEDADIRSLDAIFPKLNFNDEERRKVLIEPRSIDVQAAPGSGKTTLLAAKLYLLSQKWPHNRRGICVLSHTNVAREEIEKRLGATAGGSRLLAYPHYIGTIHGFVNQFLALPFLRSMGNAIDVIDDDVFAASALRKLSTQYILSSWVDRNPHNGPDAIRTLRYEGPELKLGWGQGQLPGSGTRSYEQAKTIKDALTSVGIFRYEDMFAYAAKLLKDNPSVSRKISWRFPFVFIDEMQDTSWAQEEILRNLFDSTVVVQRLGDRNQRILDFDRDIDKVTFPQDGYLSIGTTKRFPEAIAGAVRLVQEHPEPIVAELADVDIPPTLIVYDTEAANQVIEKFGRIVLETVPRNIVNEDSVVAVCARKQCEAKQPQGRCLADYWPRYSGTGATEKGFPSVYKLLSDHASKNVAPFNLNQQAQNVRKAVYVVLKEARSASVESIYGASGLLRQLQESGYDIQPLTRLIRTLTTTTDLTSSASVWKNTVDLMYQGLKHLLPNSLNERAFRALSSLEQKTSNDHQCGQSNECVVTSADQSLKIRIGTIHSVKGETHRATLVLESYSHLSRKLDIPSALANICSGVRISGNAHSAIKGQYRNLYVAMSRPTHLLCLAVNRQRTNDDQLNQLKSKGWRIEMLTNTRESELLADRSADPRNLNTRPMD